MKYKINENIIIDNKNREFHTNIYKNFPVNINIIKKYIGRIEIIEKKTIRGNKYKNLSCFFYYEDFFIYIAEYFEILFQCYNQTNKKFFIIMRFLIDSDTLVIMKIFKFHDTKNGYMYAQIKDNITLRKFRHVKNYDIICDIYDIIMKKKCDICYAKHFYNHITLNNNKIKKLIDEIKILWSKEILIKIFNEINEIKKIVPYVRFDNYTGLNNFLKIRNFQTNKARNKNFKNRKEYKKIKKEHNNFTIFSNKNEKYKNDIKILLVKLII
jgi:hypothetical protein